MNTRKRFQRHLLALAVLATLAGAAQAQVSTSTLRGQVTLAEGQTAQPGLQVLAVNRDNGQVHRVTTMEGGRYVLVGLAPGRYEIRIGEGKNAVSQLVELQVGQTASLDLQMAAQGQNVTIVGSLQRQGVVDSQVGTHVSRRMIDALPQSSRNFLSSADLAPGVRFETDQGGNTRLRAGAQDANNVNVYIDGVGQKNNILRGGITGQDTSEGNPFPQSAIAEYKVLTQNYKAEFDQLSSAAITAVTRSGTNTLQGDVYVNRTGSNWRATNPLEKEAQAAGVTRPSYSQVEKGFSLGGPIREDALHFFLAYDGKDIDRPKQITGRNFDKYPGNPGVVSDLLSQRGGFVQKFTEHLLFGKLNARIDADQRIEASLKVRREDGYKLENDLATASTALNNKNEETRLDIKHEWANGPWLNEARVGYEDARWNPQSDAASPLIRYKYSVTNELKNAQDVIWAGGSPNAQDRGQSGVYLKNDITWTGLSGHVVKAGAQFKDMKYSLGGTAFRVDAVNTVLDSVTGKPYYDGANCTGTNVVNNGNQSDQCSITRALDPAGVSFRNKQIGMYVQDDWAVTRQLEVNLGLRWDYESNMLNNNYVTPQDRVQALKGLDTTRWGITPPAGQTYAQSLAKGGINIDDYIATGNSRKSFKGAIAPRIGASFDLNGDKSTVIYGGIGRSYDRTMANHALDELQKNAQKNGEIWLVRNDIKMPYADQFSLGIRQAVNVWNLEATVSDIRGKNQFHWFGGNRDANGGYATQSAIDPLWGGPNGYGTLILGDTVGENHTQSLFLKAEKPYTRTSGWGMTVAYTLANAKTTNRDWKASEMFDWTHGRSTHTWNPSTEAERHRLVVAGVHDRLLPWDMSLSAKFTYGSGLPYRITSCAAGWDKCVSVKGEGDAFKQFDLGVAKNIKMSSGVLRLRADILNLFNTTNWGYYNEWGGGPVSAGAQANAVGGDNLDLGKKTGLRGDMRALKLTMSYSF